MASVVNTRRLANWRPQRRAIAWFAGAVAVFALLVAGLTGRTVLRPIEIGNALAALGDVLRPGVQVTATSARLILAPTPRLILSEMRLRRLTGEFDLTAPEVEIALDPWALLFGEFAATSVEVHSAVLRAPFPITAITQRSAIAEMAALLRGAAWEAPEYVPDLIVRKLSIVCVCFDGSGIDSAPRATIETLILTTRWPESAVRLHVQNVSWRGQDTLDLDDLAVTLPARQALVEAREGPIEARLAAGTTRATLIGRGVIAADISIKGDLAMQALEHSLTGWLGGARENVQAVRTAGIKAQLDADARGFSLESLQLSVGTQRFDGVASLRRDEPRWVLAATLAGEIMNVQRADLVALTHETPLRSLLEKDVNLDLRLSLQATTIGGLRLEDAALSFLLRPDRAEASIVSARHQRGTAKGRLLLTPSPSGIDLRASATAERIDWASLNADLLGMRLTSGSGGLTLSLESSGATFDALLNQAKGTLTAHARHGELAGYDFEGLLGGTDAGPAAADPAARTRFESLAATLTISRHRVALGAFALNAKRFTLAADGEVALPGQTLEIVVQMSPTEGDATSYRVFGPLAAPSAVPVANGRIGKRSALSSKIRSD